MLQLALELFAQALLRSVDVLDQDGEELLARTEGSQAKAEFAAVMGFVGRAHGVHELMQENFVPLHPDLAAESRSPTYALREARGKLDHRCRRHDLAAMVQQGRAFGIASVRIRFRLDPDRAVADVVQQRAAGLGVADGVDQLDDGSEEVVRAADDDTRQPRHEPVGVGRRALGHRRLSAGRSDSKDSPADAGAQ
jgi:hypothetical protein